MIASELHPVLHEHFVRLQQCLLRVVHEKKSQNSQRFEQTASHFLLASIMIRICG